MADATTPAPDPHSGRPRASGPSFCDLIMKGGVTSGLVYPLAVVELARKYRFKNIGGTSAGALAAALAAAAEYGRESGGFAKLERISSGAGDILLDLFQPVPPFRPLFRAFLGILHRRTRVGRTLAVLGALLRGYSGQVWAGAMPGLLLGILMGTLGRPLEGWLLAALVLLAGVTVALAWAVRQTIVLHLPRHGFGMCSGLTGADKGSSHKDPALTEWLTDQLDDLAGRDITATDCPPLTFGDLAGGNLKNPAINLVLMTTNITAGRPHRIPFDQNIFMYSAREFAVLFPSRVCRWMREHSQPVAGAGTDGDLRRLPRTEDLPVAVAVRLSLSFPVLIAAVPLWAFDYTFRDPGLRATPQRCWFSDGGITSNFPIQFFDTLWPRRPTFGIMLERFDPRRHRENVWLPQGAGEGILTDFGDIGSTVSFLKAIVATMQNWRDNMQTVLPGYRERVVHIRLRSGEGGLMLNMPPALAARLAGYGGRAGAVLREDFDMDAHRWRRYLVSMARLEDLLAQAEGAAKPHAAAGPDAQEGYLEFLVRYGPAPAEYRQTSRWRADAYEDSTALVALAHQWLGAHPLRGGEIPRPATEIRIVPRV